MINVAITTLDNPYDPFSQYEEWRRFDVQKGYFSSELLDRVVSIDSDTPDELAEELISNAIDDIIEMERVCKLDDLIGVGVHMKVKRRSTHKTDETSEM